MFALIKLIDYMATVCPNVPAMAEDPRFQELKERYKGRGWNDFVLAVQLKCFRNAEDLDIDWYPSSDEDYKLLTDYINRPIDNTRSEKINKEYLDGLYKTMTTLYPSPGMLENRLGLIGRWFKTRIDRLQKDMPNLDRIQVIRSQAKDGLNGYQAIMDDVFKMVKSLSTVESQKKQFEAQNPGASDALWESQKSFWENRAKEFEKLYNNKELLAALVAPSISSSEGIAISIDGLTFDFKEDEADVVEDAEPMEDNSVDNGEAQKGERFVDFRTLSMMSTLSTQAKNLISSLNRVDANGKTITDDIGYPIPLDIKQTAIALHRVLRLSEPETMMDDLRRSIARYPNLRSLVSYLENNPDDRGLIYSSFKKAKSNYYYGYKNDNGRLDVHSAGNAAEGFVLASEAGANISIGSTGNSQFSVVDNAGNLKEAELFDRLYNRSFYQDLNDIDWVEYSDENDKLVNELAERLIGLGLKISADDIKTVFKNYPVDTKFNGGSINEQSPMEYLSTAMREVYDRARGLIKINDDLTGSRLYNYAQDSFTKIAEVLSPIQRGETEERIISGDKSLSVYNNPNALHQLVDSISNANSLSKEEYRKEMMRNYGQYEGMGLGFGNETHLTGWLADASGDNTDINWRPESFRLIDMTDSDKKDYANLTNAQHLVNSYAMYMRGAKNKTDSIADNGHMYEVPIQADYETAYNFIFAPGYTYEQLIERLANEVECEAQRIAAIKERIANDPSDPNAELTRAKVSTYEKRGINYQIFPELNNNGFAEEYAIADPINAHEVVRRAVDEQLQKLIASERQKLEQDGFFSEDNMKLAGIKNANDKSINDWLLNSFYARQQITKLLYGGLESFKNTSDFEKRNMYAHATRIPLYTEATYKGEKVGRKDQRVVYISDDISKSAIFDKIEKIANRLRSEGKITDEQEKRLVDSYKEITTTDGQGIRTLDSMRRVKIMASLWTDADEAAYRNIKSGKYTPEDVEHFMVGLKPIYTGYEILPAQAGQYQKPQRVPVLHKYSEMVLLPELEAGISLQNDSVPFQSLNKINEKLGKGNEIDLFIFGSGVKIGGHSLIKAFAKDEDGNRILKDSDSISDFVSNKIKSGDFWVHTLPFKYYGIAAATHADVVDKQIAWASQAEKEAWANILPDEKISVNGNDMLAVDARELYNKIKEARTIDTFKKLRKLFYSDHRLAETLKEELASKPYQSRELAFILQMIDGEGSWNTPLYQPSIQHDAVALLSSILKKRLTKVPTKGANIIQTSGFGMDMDASGFENEKALKNSDKLEVKFDKNGNFKYVEAYVPIYDSRLLQFADEWGNISPDRLNKLIKDGFIPESILHFIAYRTPSDAEHSIIPCRVKGFIANTAGASIRLPKEIMPMTGHDYDGDKMRCHFKEFYIGWNDKKIRKEFDEYSDSEAIKAILDTNKDATLTPYEVFRNNITSDTNLKSGEYRAAKEVRYDYDKSPLNNIGDNGDYSALNNALVDLMFAQLTSPNGSMKMFIPGGNAETTMYAKTMQVMRAYGTEKGRQIISDILRGTGVSRDSAGLYKYLTTDGESKLDDIISAINSNNSPFTVTHATDSHEYMMDGAGMIGVYAVYNSAAAMFQRLNLSYIPSKNNEEKSIPVSFFGKNIDRLFKFGKNEQFPILGLARLVNAAVDNGKNPVLGHLNQTAQLAPITNFLFAAGMTEEEIHLILNQPALIELGKRLKDPNSDGFSKEASTIQREIKKGLPKDSKFNREDSLKRVAEMGVNDYAENLSKSYQNILAGTDTDKRNQIYILQSLQHIYGAAMDLDSFTKLTRPESNAGSIDASLGGTTAKIIQLEDFRHKIANGECSIAGVWGVIGKKRVYFNSMTPKLLDDAIGNELPEVSVLNTLLKDAMPKLFREKFPQMKESWQRLTKRIARQYSYDKIPGKVVERIQSDMILWKLLSNPKFTTDNPQAEQRRVLISVPKQLGELKNRIQEAANNKGNDALADRLSNNVFLNNLELGSTINEENEQVKRIRFKQNGPSVEDTADLIRAGWDQLWREEETRQLAEDLFKYNLYTNGFSYGRYEFYHYAPFSVLNNMDGYKNALMSIRNDGWSDDDAEQFYHQYCMNHWGDKNIFKKVKIDQLPMRLRNSIGINAPSRNSLTDSQFMGLIGASDYIIVPTKVSGRTEDKLYRIKMGSAGPAFLEEAQKLGIRNRNNQVMVQYNPKIRDYHEVKPFFKSNNVSWETKQEAQSYNNEQISEAERQAKIDEIPFDASLYTAENNKTLREEAEKASNSNGKLTAEQAAALGFDEDVFYSLRSNTNLISDSLSSALKNGDWDKPVVEEFNELINKIKDGKINFERTVGEGSSYARSISEAHVGASIIAGGTYGSSEAQSRNPQTEYENDAAEGREQERRLEAWAKANDLWLNDYEDPNGEKANNLEDLLHSQWGYIDQGSEAEVYRYDDNTVLKSINLSHSNDNPAKALDRIALFNQLFPETSMSIVGFGRDSLGHFRIIATQRLIAGSEITDEQLKDFHKKFEFQKSGPWFFTTDNSILITDLSPSNILIDSDGNYFVIDADVVYNTPNRGGAVQFSNTIINTGINSDGQFKLVSRDSNGDIVSTSQLATPGVVRKAREQQVFVELNKRLRQILEKVGVSIGQLDEAEARLGAGGVSDFNTAMVLAEGMKELIRLSNGIEGEYALPEEFAHVAVEMLGRNHPLVSRLLNALRNDEKALEEAYDGMLDEYKKQYNNDNEKLVVEAAGKLIAKHLFLHQQTKTNSVKNLVKRVCEAIKNFFRKISLRDVEEAVFDAEGIASQLARDLLSGRIVDQMSFDNITTSQRFFNIDKDLSDKKDIISRLLANTQKRIDVLQRRLKYKLGKGGSSRSLDESKRQLEKLEKASQNQKLEITIVDYLKDVMAFMEESKNAMDDAINNLPANSVCRKLNTIKDTMYGFAQAIQAIKDARNSGELKDEDGLKEAIRDVSGAMEDFWNKYHNIGMIYFKKFLSNVYGEEGVTINVGKQKGRKITIEDMATHADHDISFFSRWLHAASDMNDFVIQAMDRVTRDAKMAARDRVRELRPRFEAAFDTLVKEQGNRDTSWMYERKTENGKKVKTGKYITEKEAKELSEARQNYYKVFMELMAEADKCVPDVMISDRHIIMFRKQHYERLKEAKGIKGVRDEEWENIKRNILEMGDVDYENEQVVKDFNDNIVDQLPLKFLKKGKDETFDDMTDDTATALMAYLGMAFEYKAMNNVIGMLENARYMSSFRDVDQRRGLKGMVERVGDEKGFHYTKPYTVKQAKTMLQEAIDDFYQMHVYGHLRKDEGTFKNTKISKRKTADMINRFTSLSQMALNLHQRIANVNTGFTQILVESAGGKIKAKDVRWAIGLWIGHGAKRMSETGKTDYSDKLSLWMDKFDIHQDNGIDSYGNTYGKKRGSRVFNSGLLYAGLTIGEDFMSGTTALALARQYKLKGPNGEESNLWDAYKVKYEHPTKYNEKGEAIDGEGAYLALKDGYTKEDGTPLTAEDERKFQREIIGTNFELQGIYNKDDRSAIQQYSLGSLAIMYRKWIAPAMKRRYAGAQYSNLKGDFQEGYYTTAIRLLGQDLKDIFKPESEGESRKTIWQILTDIQAMENSVSLNWNKLTDYEKGNVTKAFTEIAVVAALVVASGILTNLPPDDHDGNKFLAWADDIVVTQLLRLRSEIGSQAPTPILANEALRIASSPFAALRPLRDSLNIFQLAWGPNYWEEVQSGKYKGRTKAHKYFMSLPVVSLFRKFDNFIDPSTLLNYYKNSNY